MRRTDEAGPELEKPKIDLLPGGPYWSLSSCWNGGREVRARRHRSTV
jgi:hypothetical protein